VRLPGPLGRGLWRRQCDEHRFANAPIIDPLELSRHPGRVGFGYTDADSRPTRSGQALVQADLSSVASPQTTIDTLEQVIQDRLGDAGIQSNISQTGDAQLTIDFTGTRSADFVKQVVEATNLNFRQPMIQATGDIMCKASDGVEFTAQALSTREVSDKAGTKSDICITTNQSGAVEWQPAQADVNGISKTLTQAMIESGNVEITSTHTQGTALLLPFTPEGSSLFAAITERLRNYPLGIFLGDARLNAPTVFQQISNGETELTGQTDDELAVVKAVLKGGALPVPVTVTSIEFN
jgi:preprotein translocase subunit SecD